MRYSEDLRRGFVVRHTSNYTATSDRPAMTLTTWWYGPGHGFGTTFGGLDHCVAVFPSRIAAQRAIDDGYYGTNGTRLVVESVSEARAIAAAQLARRKREASRA